MGTSQFAGFLALAVLAATAFDGVMSPLKADTASSPVGLWRTIDDNDGKPRALIRIDEEGGEYNGTIEGSLRGEPEDSVCVNCKGELRNARLIGMTILSGLVEKEPGEYEDGTILDPDNGKTYSSLASLSEDGQTLEVRGYIGISLLGRTQVWERVE